MPLPRLNQASELTPAVALYCARERGVWGGEERTFTTPACPRRAEHTNSIHFVSEALCVFSSWRKFVFPLPRVERGYVQHSCLQVDMLLTSAAHAKYHLSPLQARDSASLGRGMRGRAPCALVPTCWRARHPGLDLLWHPLLNTPCATAEPRAVLTLVRFGGPVDDRRVRACAALLTLATQHSPAHASVRRYRE